jgi:hypothetical protein
MRAWWLFGFAVALVGCKSVGEQQSLCSTTYKEFSQFAECMHRSKGSWQASTGSSRWKDYFAELDTLSAQVKKGELTDADAKRRLEEWAKAQ